ncbi:MAG: histidine--tRNA ligase [Deltaproteobacteria bacterium]|nr:histidine--tRNA ligase [Deltaproteobacteria bacterium]MBW2053070.1 histidine--tRNA ligase [Deltaproteobacteria bacterium]MBW2140509.1 histidine--tRNA ligase [Deltaproteobacteria bacterium]
MDIKAIRGFKDILPEEIGWWQQVEAVAVRLLKSYGFKELRIPVVERTELFARSIGEDTDIVEKEMYSFSDRRGESLTLRPEATAGVVRSVIEHNLAADGRALKLYSFGPMFRYERPQKGRQRQFHQFNVEAFNVSEPFIDAEVIILLASFLYEVGLKDVEIHVNSLGCPNCRPGYKEKLKAYIKRHYEELCPDCQRRYETNPLRVFDCKVEGCANTVKDAPLILDTLCEDCKDHFESVRKAVESAGVVITVAPKLVRGLDYYTRTVFEAQTGRLGAQNAVGGGGRYDNLVKNLGGSDMPAIGFALGLERLIMLLSEGKSLETSGPDLYVAALDQAAQEKAFNLIQDLRRQGLHAEMDYKPASLKSQMRRANKLGAARVLILGPDELKRGVGVLRNMTKNKQEDLPLDGAAAELKALLAKGESI